MAHSVVRLGAGRVSDLRLDIGACLLAAVSGGERLGPGARHLGRPNCKNFSLYLGADAAFRPVYTRSGDQPGWDRPDVVRQPTT